MKKSRFTEPQIIKMLNEQEQGKSVSDICRTIRVDNGPEFTSAVFEIWTRKHKIKLCFIQSGKPTQNTLVERFNGSYRKELLNAHLFTDLEQVRDQTQQWI